MPTWHSSLFVEQLTTLVNRIMHNPFAENVDESTDSELIEQSKNGSGGGSIINIGSAASRSLPPEFSIYAASKSGLNAITGVLAKELASRRIRVNSVNPGATLSEGTKEAGLYGVGSDIEKRLVSMTPLGRIGTPLDIARVVVFLASEDSSWLTGEIIHATGGL